MPRQVHAEQGEVEQRLGDEVAVAHRVEGVLERRGEAEVGRDAVGIERQRRAGQRAGAERRHVEPRDGSSSSRSTSRASAQPWASRWWASSTGWARCRWV